jgi:hypothetical protein
MDPATPDPLLAAVSEFAAAVRSAQRSQAQDAAETREKARAVVAARVQLCARLVELGWAPPARIADGIRGDERLLGQSLGGYRADVSTDGDLVAREAELVRREREAARGPVDRDAAARLADDRDALADAWDELARNARGRLG